MRLVIFVHAELVQVAIGYLVELLNVHFALFVQNLDLYVLDFLCFDLRGVIGDGLFAVRGEEIVVAASVRHHAFEEKLEVWLHLAHVAGFVFLEGMVHPDRLLIGLAGFPRNPFEGGFLPIFAEPASVGQAASDFEVSVNRFDASNADMAQLIAHVFVFWLDLQKSIRVDIAFISELGKLPEISYVVHAVNGAVLVENLGDLC